MGDELQDGVAPPASGQAPAPRSALDKPHDANTEWFEQEARLVNKLGLHAYPAHVVAYVASCFKKADITVRHGDRAVDAKSVLMLLSLSSDEPLVKGTRLTVRASGINAKTAVTVLAAVLSSGFGEE